MIPNIDILLLFAIIIILTVAQSVFGVGLLLFGTPSLLLLGYSFTETLSYLIPCSITVSTLQVYSNWNKIGKYRFNVFFYLLPMVAIGLSIIILYTSVVNLYLIIGIMLLVTSVIRLFPQLNDLLGAILANNFKIGLAVIGLVHGLTNLGGAPLVAITSSIYNKKTKILPNIAYAYLTMALVQTIVLAILGNFTFSVIMLFLPVCSATVYLVAGKYVFEITNEKYFKHLMTLIIFLYSLILIYNAF